jgi:hypothetical protein
MATKKRSQPNWQISRGFVGPMGRVFFRPIFTVKARSRDQAIWCAAHMIKGIALLKARRLKASEPMHPASIADIADIDANLALPPPSFFLHIKLSKK